MKTMLRKSQQQCWPFGQPFAEGSPARMYQRVQVRKTSPAGARPGPSGYNARMPSEESARERLRVGLRPYPSLMHDLIVRQDSIIEVKEKALAG